MSRKARSLQNIDARLRELAAAKSALEQELDQALGRAVRRTCEHAPPDVWTAVQTLLAPHVRSEADRRALKLAQAPDAPTAASAPSPPSDVAPHARGARGPTQPAAAAGGAPTDGVPSIRTSAAQLTLT